MLRGGSVWFLRMIATGVLGLALVHKAANKVLSYVRVMCLMLASIPIC